MASRLGGRCPPFLPGRVSGLKCFGLSEERSRSTDPSHGHAMTGHSRTLLRWVLLAMAWPLVLTILSLRRSGQCPLWADRVADELGFDAGITPLGRPGEKRS